MLYFNNIQTTIASILSSWRPIGDTQALNTNYILNINNFSTTKPILDPKVSLDRSCQDLKLCSKINPLGVIPRTLAHFFIIKYYAVFYPQGNTFRTLWVLKTIFNIFSTTRQILKHKLSFDRERLNLNLCLKKASSPIIYRFELLLCTTIGINELLHLYSGTLHLNVRH